MNDAEVSAWGKSLLLKIHVITGWIIPDAELLTILIDQFQKKMVESYPNTNPQEIEYAFRNFGTTVKDWGKAMNLSLIDEVMIPYLEERKRISHAYEERAAPVPEQQVMTDAQILDYQRQRTEEFYQRIRRGRVEQVPEIAVEALLADGLIGKREDADLFFVNKLNAGAANIYVKNG